MKKHETKIYSEQTRALDDAEVAQIQGGTVWIIPPDLRKPPSGGGRTRSFWDLISDLVRDGKLTGPVRNIY